VVFTVVRVVPFLFTRVLTVVPGVAVREAPEVLEVLVVPVALDELVVVVVALVLVLVLVRTLLLFSTSVRSWAVLRTDLPA
jgi:hypothetical protein